MNNMAYIVFVLLYLVIAWIVSLWIYPFIMTDDIIEKNGFDKNDNSSRIFCGFMWPFLIIYLVACFFVDVIKHIFKIGE